MAFNVQHFAAGIALHSRIPGTAARENPAEPNDAIDKYRIFEIIETVNADCILGAKASVSEPLHKPANGLTTLRRSPESGCIRSINVQRSMLVESWFVKIPREQVFGWNPARLIRLRDDEVGVGIILTRRFAPSEKWP